ncbi:hypothetical protein AB0J38_26145 [Streptomyces sp. NPDC050095]|uniref:hypothetical protein n=1 Tax=unclassified Streptomyces TaxID=2593676 RepID=UPI003412C71B
MGLTAGTKSAVVIAAGILASGFAVILRTTVSSNVAGAVGGASLVMVGLIGLLMLFLRHWVTTTSEERRALAEAQGEAQAERSRYVALQAANESEHGRVLRDVAATRAALKATLDSERRKLRAEFAGTRATELAEAFQTGVEMERSGALQATRSQRGNLIPFPGLPGQQSVPAAERERSREHGSVGP